MVYVRIGNSIKTFYYRNNRHVYKFDVLFMSPTVRIRLNFETFRTELQ